MDRLQRRSGSWSGGGGVGEPVLGTPGKRTLVEQVFRKSATSGSMTPTQPSIVEQRASLLSAAQKTSGAPVEAGVREEVETAIVVEASDTAGNAERETINQIAMQNGISAARLRRANPGVNFAALVRGQHLLIPKH